MAGVEHGAELARTVPGNVAYRVTEIPRRVDPHMAEAGPRRQSDPGRAHRAAVLTAAYHAGLVSPGAGAIAFGWLRTETAGPVRVIVAGGALAGGALAPGPMGPGGHAGRPPEVLLALPGGARGTPLPPGEFASLLSQIGCWREVAGISDGLLAPAGESAPAASVMLPLEEGLLGGWTGEFGWLVTAEPLSTPALTALAAEAGRRQQTAGSMADRVPERAAQARRLKERHGELERGLSAGFWRITVTAGGRDEASAARIAGLLCASADLTGLPYALSPAPWPAPGRPGEHGQPAGAGSCEPGGDARPASPFYGSTSLLAALARPPESEIPGVRLALRPDFDVTPDAPPPAPPPGAGAQRDDPARVGEAAFHLGEILDRDLMPAGPFTLAAGSLNRHVLVCGSTGAGKSQTVRSLLETATGQGIRWLVVEPAKAEYRLMAGRLPGSEVIRIRPGEPDAIAAGLNPLEPAAASGGARFPLQTHADLVKALFIASFQAEEPFPQVLGAALSRAYADAGWDLALGEPRRPGAAYPTLTSLQRAADQVVAGIGYSQRVTDDVLGFIRVRISSLRQGTTGRFLEGGHPLDFGALLRKNVVLEIEDVGDDADKAFLMGTVLIRLAEHLRLAHRTAVPGAVTSLRHVTVVEEAHRLLRRMPPGGSGGTGAAGHAVEMFAGLLAEIRAYGEGLIIAEQIPARLVPDVIKNTAVKIVHRLPAADDREAVGAAMNATPAQSRYLVTLRPGQAAVSSDGMDFPVLVSVDDGTERERLTPASTAGPRTVVRPRSATCGGECAARPCTLRDMRGGQWALDDLPWVRLWAELAVLAHLTGWPCPVPQPAVLATFTALPARVVQCALSHAVDAAVGVRAGTGTGETAARGARALIAHPGELAVHVTAALRARAERHEWFCSPDEPRWLLAGEPGEDVLFGVIRPSVIEGAVGAGGPLRGMLSGFVECDWPLRYLSQPVR